MENALVWNTNGKGSERSRVEYCALPVDDEFVSMFSDDDKHVIDRLSKAKDLSRGTVEGFVRHVLNNKRHSIEQ